MSRRFPRGKIGLSSVGLFPIGLFSITPAAVAGQRPFDAKDFRSGNGAETTAMLIG